VRASPFTPSNPLMSDDLPTLERQKHDVAPERAGSSSAIAVARSNRQPSIFNVSRSDETGGPANRRPSGRSGER
jgi:hypothetical protein